MTDPLDQRAGHKSAGGWGPYAEPKLYADPDSLADPGLYADPGSLADPDLRAGPKLYADPGVPAAGQGPYAAPEGTAARERFAERPSSRYGPRRAHARQPKKRRRLRRAVLVLLAVVVVAAGGTYGWAETRLQRDVDLGAYGDRPPPGEGTNYLIVGSDSRDGLSDDDVKDLHAGGGGGRRTDSMMLLHSGSRGTSMISLPRDSWITVPGRLDTTTGKTKRPERDKLNAAFSYGGPELLVHTVEKNTGLRIDHYAEIGFAGFVNIVDAIGGVRMCLDRDIKDEKSGADLRKGCHTLTGRQALAFVRQRHQERQGDLGRSKNQQKFLSTLAHQAAQPDTLFDPTQIGPAMQAGLDTLIVDKDMTLRDLSQIFLAVQSVAGGHGKQINVPLSGIGVPTPKGNVLKWDARESARLFDDLRYDRPVTERGKMSRRWGGGR
ncbi:MULTISPECIES: LCP family protein [Streptomyces]|uniref:Regulatory protein MsrR n=1 Tax=Streptomyces rimosus subsp. rimosus TaxID=132474 RepID=A0ABY3ZCQ4_STRRM|nr:MULTISPECIES: LCP family protein [Streptomyces]KUJ39182.1 transcriptional regulator [Streptomyces rimosus subsp. rimosus]UNZ08076.1 Regulatory protein MsrR [Streptomyces rimosus subsp. rimosus]UTH93241.1 Regulatory protein MsrR [Streptomyces rimosus subsp. rimosus]UTJ11335.1 Regulatory protein MsrR [Streptomyces rimosus subsp. rimosus]